MRNSSIRETAMLGDALDRVAALLPASWRLDTHDASADQVFDAIADLVAPNASVSFAVEAKRSGSIPAAQLIAVLRNLRRATAMPVLFVSDYIGPALRDTLASEDFSFADATGWVRLTAADPLVLLTGQGTPRSPRPPTAGAITRLNGLAASRIIRTLATADLPLRVRGLAGVADVSPGSVSKLLVTLASEGIVDRDEDGSVVAVRRRALLRRWVADYSFANTNRSVGYFIAPRGLERTMARIMDQTGVVITGSAAARRMLPESSTSVVPLRLLAVYAPRPAELARVLGLIDAEPSAANVAVARPQDPDILIPAAQEGLAAAPPPLVIADLLTLPGRSDAEAEQLMDALAATDEAWKE